MENYDEEFSVHQQNRSQGITCAIRFVLLAISAWRIAQRRFWKALRSDGGLFSVKFLEEPKKKIPLKP